MIIGISGKIGSGKTELARSLYDQFGYTPKIFAGKLKQVASILTGLPLAFMYNRDKKNMYLDTWGMTLGELQQKLGTDAVRNGLHQDAWINALFADYKDSYTWSIGDVRFSNEADLITRMGGLLVRIEGSRTGPGSRDPQHSSEIALDYYQFDYTFTNDGTLMQLAEHAQAIYALATARYIRDA